MQCEDALKDEDMGGVDGVFVRKPGVLLERVDWNVNLLPVRVLAGDPGNHDNFFAYPDLMSRRCSTSRSKSIAAGASKSYSFLKAALDSSGVSGL